MLTRRARWNRDARAATATTCEGGPGGVPGSGRKAPRGARQGYRERAKEDRARRPQRRAASRRRSPACLLGAFAPRFAVPQ
ncbi:hypothetical protein BLKGLAD_01170 [Burkholderia gladioli pv. gladioli]